MLKDKYLTSMHAQQTHVIDLPGADVSYTPDFLAPDVAAELYQAIVTHTHWRQEQITLFGKTHPTPRLSCWMGDASATYSYSNIVLSPVPWSPLVKCIKSSIEAFTQHSYNSVLINYYRDGQDSNGWHSDDEAELGLQPVIASLSLGADRDFKFRHKYQKELKKSLLLEHGSLLLMRGDTQRNWQHHLPKRAHVGGRLNLTFRTIIEK